MQHPACKHVPDYELYSIKGGFIMSHTSFTEKGVYEGTGSTVSRREFLTISAAGVGAVTAAGYGLSAKGADASESGSSRSSSKPPSNSAPFDTLREYIEALEERGLVLRF